MKFVGGDSRIIEQLAGDAQSIVQERRPLVVVDFVKTLVFKRVSSENILLRFEGPTSSPLSHTSFYARKFKTVLDVGSQSNVPWPLKDIDFSEFRTEARVSGAVMILGNKLSFSKSELYSLRRQMALQLKKLDVFGTDWQISNKRRLDLLFRSAVIAILAQNLKRSATKYWFSAFPQTALPVHSKAEVYSRFKVAVVVENDLSRVTEKLFDALAAGCRVIYVGPPLEGYDPQILERVVECSPNIDEISSTLDRELNSPWSLPSRGHEKALKAHIAGSSSELVRVIAVSAVSSAKNTSN
jgi:hypothetical protein